MKSRRVNEIVTHHDFITLKEPRILPAQASLEQRER